MLDILKEQVVAVAKEAERLGMCRHKSGNFSIYDPETGYVVITPSGVARDVLGPEHVCVMDLSGKVIERAAEVKPSSEAMMHLYIYKERKDIRAIVHTHARYSTAFSIMNKPIMPIVYECAYLGKTGTVLAHLTVALQQPWMAKYLLGKGHIQGHQENGPVDGVESDDILANQMKVSGPVLLKLVCTAAVTIITNTGDIVGQGIQPYIGHMLRVKINGDAPAEGGPGHA